MRSHSLKIALLLALFSSAAALGAGEEQDNRSYLPPPSLRGEPDKTPAALDRVQATVRREASDGVRRQSVKVVHRRHNQRAFSRRREGPGFFFGL